jgi:nicotinamide phosphoribosyltransferase
VPLRVPLLTIRNTHDDFFWLTNMLETLMSAELWGPITSATTAFGYRKVFEEFARKTGASKEFVKWQGHDFSMRGLYGVDAAIKSGAAHLLSFTGTDTIPAIDFLEEYYGANSDRELIGGSVPATEHSVMSMGGQDGEFETFRRLVAEVYPSAIVSIVSDTWDLWEVIGSYLPRLRDTIKAREGKVVIRPDSGDPVKVLCGDPEAVDSFVRKGVVECLWDIFGGTTNASGFRELDPHIGTIYGDSINRERQRAILEGLAKKGFASSNVVLGIGSYTYQHVTRDTYGLAVKATYGEVNGNMRPIFKAPKTDDGIKNSAKGLLVVEKIDGTLKLTENVQWVHEGNGVLQTIFLDGKLHNRTTLAEIRARIEEQL